MGHPVKKIFKLLIGVIVLTTVGCMVVEFMNMQLYATRLSQIMREALQTSCMYYEQETYKTDSTRTTSLINSGNTYNLSLGKDLTDTVITGKFYEGSDAEEVYKNIYGDGSDFIDWCTTGSVSGQIVPGVHYNDTVKIIDETVSDINKTQSNVTEPCIFWENLRDIYCYLKMGDNSPVEFLDKGCGNPDKMTMEETRDLGEQYIDELMTPLNLGVAYIDHKTLNRIFRWVSTSMLANGIIGDAGESELTKSFRQLKKTNIDGSDGSEVYFVDWNGFRIYLGENNLYLDNIEYTICDCNSDNGKTTAMNEMNIDTEALYNALDDERAAVMLDRLSYHIDITYEGITPLRSIIQWFLGRNGDNQRVVAGYSADSSYANADGSLRTGSNSISRTKDNGYVKNDKGNAEHYKQTYAEDSETGQGADVKGSGDGAFGARTFLDHDTDEINFSLTAFMDIRYYILK